jgi:hypothetical protein
LLEPERQRDRQHGDERDRKARRLELRADRLEPEIAEEMPDHQQPEAPDRDPDEQRDPEKPALPDSIA